MSEHLISLDDEDVKGVFLTQVVMKAKRAIYFKFTLFGPRCDFTGADYFQTSHLKY